VCRPGDHRPAQTGPRRLHRADVSHRLKAYAPKPPNGAQPPPMLGSRVSMSGRCSATDHHVTARSHAPLPALPSSAARGFRDYFKANRRQTIAEDLSGTSRTIGADRRVEAELAGLAGRHDLGAGSTAEPEQRPCRKQPETVMEWGPLLKARKRSSTRSRRQGR